MVMVTMQRLGQVAFQKAVQIRKVRRRDQTPLASSTRPDFSLVSIDPAQIPVADIRTSDWAEHAPLDRPPAFLGVD